MPALEVMELLEVDAGEQSAAERAAEAIIDAAFAQPAAAPAPARMPEPGAVFGAAN